MTACPSCGGQLSAAHRFCPSCGAPAVAEPDVRKTVPLLFCDVSGSTAMGEQLDPEALRAVMAEYFAVARQAIEQHGGTGIQAADASRGVEPVYVSVATSGQELGVGGP